MCWLGVGVLFAAGAYLHSTLVSSFGGAAVDLDTNTIERSNPEPFQNQDVAVPASVGLST